MPHSHPEARLLRRFLQGEATPAELRELVWHLLETCPDCAGAVDAESAHRGPMRLSDAVVTGRSPGLLGAAGDVVLDRVRSRLQPTLDLMARERAEAPALLAELQRHPLERQRLLIRNTPRFHSLPLADLLLEAAWQQRQQRPEEVERWVELGLELLDQIDPAVGGEGLLNDFRGRAWAYLGNLRRIRAELRGAEEAFRRAEEYLAAGTGDLLEVARLLGLKATLRRLQLRFDEAAGMIRESLEIYEALDEKHLAGRAMVTQAIVMHAQGDPAGALDVLRSAQKMIEPERDEYLVRVVQQNKVTYLLELGNYEEAMSLVPALRRRMVESGSRAELLHLRWQEGRLLQGLGHDSRAEAAFLEVRKGFVEEGLAHDAASVSLELASLYLRQGRTGEIRDLAAQLLPIFQSRDLHQEATAALLLFQRAVERESLTLRLVEEVADALRRAREKPRRKSDELS